VGSLRAEIVELKKTSEALLEAAEGRRAALEAILVATRAQLATCQSKLDAKASECVALTASAAAAAEESRLAIEKLEGRNAELAGRLRDKSAALSAYHEQIEFNARKREEARAATPVKKPSLLDSLAKKLHLDGQDRPRDEDLVNVDMFTDINASSNSSIGSNSGGSGSFRKLAGAGASSNSNSLNNTSGSSGGSGGMGAGGRGTPPLISKAQQNELAEEVAVSLTRRLQQSEGQKLALEQQLAQLRRQLAQLQQQQQGHGGQRPNGAGGAPASARR
jgi:hypothetical protein